MSDAIQTPPPPRDPISDQVRRNTEASRSGWLLLAAFGLALFAKKRGKL